MKQKKREQHEVEKAILRGEYKDYYLQYDRRSRDDAENQKNSLSFQQTENTRAMEREGLSLANVTLNGFCQNGVIAESDSSFKQSEKLTISDSGVVQFSMHRPKFTKMVYYLNKGLFKGVMFLCWDKASRNKFDNTILEKLIENGVDVRFATVKYQNTSAGVIHRGVDAMFAEYHSVTTSEKVGLSISENRRNGFWFHRAPLGYQNLGTTEHKPFDSERAPIIRELFMLYMTGQWSLNSLAKFANEQGLTTVPMRRKRTRAEKLDASFDISSIPKVSRPITANHVSRILSNPFYMGKILDEFGGYQDSKCHDALVSQEEFAQVQALLNKNTVSVHYVDKIDLPLRGLIRCGECKRAFTPYRKKGILYFGARCSKSCTNKRKSVNFNFFNDALAEYLGNLPLRADEKKRLNACLSELRQVSAKTEQRDKAVRERRMKNVKDCPSSYDLRLVG